MLYPLHITRIHILHVPHDEHISLLWHKIKGFWWHCRVVSNVSFTPKHIFGLLVHFQVFSDGDGAACCGLKRVPIRRPAHWNLVPPIAIDKVLTLSLDSRGPWQCPAIEFSESLKVPLCRSCIVLPTSLQCSMASLYARYRLAVPL